VETFLFLVLQINNFRFRTPLNHEISVSENPQRKALVKDSDDWPFQGRIHDIQWTGD